MGGGNSHLAATDTRENVYGSFWNAVKGEGEEERKKNVNGRDASWRSCGYLSREWKPGTASHGCMYALRFSPNATCNASHMHSSLSDDLTVFGPGDDRLKRNSDSPRPISPPRRQKQPAQLYAVGRPSGSSTRQPEAMPPSKPREGHGSNYIKRAYSHPPRGSVGQSRLPNSCISP
jgi:hypothetical protein